MMKRLNEIDPDENINVDIIRAEDGLKIDDEYLKDNKIKILGRGENQLAIITPDETRQPANRRVEIKKTN